MASDLRPAIQKQIHADRRKIVLNQLYVRIVKFTGIEKAVEVEFIVPAQVFLPGSGPFLQFIPHVLRHIPVSGFHIFFELLEVFGADDHGCHKLSPQGPFQVEEQYCQHGPDVRNGLKKYI